MQIEDANLIISIECDVLSYIMQINWILSKLFEYANQSKDRKSFNIS